MLLRTRKCGLKYATLKNLLAIQSNNYLGENGHDYDPQEIDDMIWQKQAKKDAQDLAKKLKELYEEPPQIPAELAQVLTAEPPPVPANIKQIPVILKGLDLSLKDQLINQAMGIVF